MSQLKIVVKDSQHLKKLIKEDVNHELDLGSLDVSNVTDMSHLFENSTRNDFSGIESWDMSNVNNIDSMFYKAYGFNHDVSAWKLSSLSLEKKSANYLLYNVFFRTASFAIFMPNMLNSESLFIDTEETHYKFPFSKKIICSVNCTGQNFNKFLPVFKDLFDDPLSLFDVSCLKDFSHLLENADLKSYKGLEDWVTTNANNFSYFACNAKKL